MFTSLKQRIKKTIILLITIFIIFISSLSMITLSIYLINDFSKSKQYIINLSITNFEFDLSLIKSNTTALSSDEDIINYVINNINPQLAINKISSISNYFDAVIGVTLYQTNTSNSVATSSISKYPLLNELKSISCINDFINSDDKSIINLRTSHIADFYQSTYYDDSYGMISYLVKIEEGNQLYGLIVVDISPEYIYNKYFNFNDYQDFTGTITLITTYNDEDYLKCNDNLNNSHFLSYKKLDSFDLYDLNNYVYQTSFLDNYRLITIIPINNLLINLSIILLIIILIDCILILLTIIGGKKLANYVTHELEKLKDKMQNDQITHSN